MSNEKRKLKMDRFNSLIEEAKEVYLLVLCDLIADRISCSVGYEVAVEALEKCWEWVQSKNVEADQLYFYLETIDEKDIMTYMLLEKNENNEAVWLCIANALAYIIWTAYQYDGETYMPETIECIDEETIESFWLNFNKTFVGSNISDKLLDYMVKNYSDKKHPQSVDILLIRQFVKDNM